MANVKIKINGKQYAVPEGITVLEAAKANGIYIPTLCAYEGMKPKAACRLCIVNIKGEDKEKLACATKVKDGMVITTDSDELFAKRKETVQEMFRQHTVDCHHCMRIGSTKAKDFEPSFCKDCYFCDCVRDGFCELQQKALEFGIDELPFEIHEHDFVIDDSTGSVIRDPNKCIKCRRCVDVCKAQGVGILGLIKTENGQTVGAKGSLMADGCVRCGRCVNVCPTGALFMKEHKDEEIYIAHQYGTETAAMVCSCVLRPLEELFGAPKGSFTYEQVIDGLRKIGIDHVYNPAFAKHTARWQAADMLDKKLGKKCVIMAEDFAAKNFLEKNYPEFKEQFLFYDSMQKAFGDYMHEHYPNTKLYHITLRNSYGAEAKETGDVDYFINARELYRIFLRTGVNPGKRRGSELEELCEYERCERYDALLSAGGWKLDGEPEELDFEENGKTYKAAICHNLGQVKKAVESMDKYDVIKVIA